MENHLHTMEALTLCDDPRCDILSRCSKLLYPPPHQLAHPALHHGKQVVEQHRSPFSFVRFQLPEQHRSWALMKYACQLAGTILSLSKTSSPSSRDAGEDLSVQIFCRESMQFWRDAPLSTGYSGILEC